MSTALTYIYYIINKGVNFVFNDMVIDNNVTVGWIFVSVVVFGILMGSILNLPHHMRSYSSVLPSEIVSVSGYDRYGFKHTYSKRYKA